MLDTKKDRSEGWNSDVDSSDQYVSSYYTFSKQLQGRISLGGQGGRGHPNIFWRFETLSTEKFYHFGWLANPKFWNLDLAVPITLPLAYSPSWGFSNGVQKNPSFFVRAQTFVFCACTKSNLGWTDMKVAILISAYRNPSFPRTS